MGTAPLIYVDSLQDQPGLKMSIGIARHCWWIKITLGKNLPQESSWDVGDKTK